MLSIMSMNIYIKDDIIIVREERHTQMQVRMKKQKMSCILYSIVFYS